MNQSTTVLAYIALGANLGDRAAQINSAVNRLRATPGVIDIRTSSLLETPAVGGPANSPDFLNAVAEVRTNLSAIDLFARLLEIERKLGRIRNEKWGPRVIDLDLILFGEQVIDQPELSVPHPLMHERLFVLQPLVEIAPGAWHPLLKATAAELLARLR